MFSVKHSDFSNYYGVYQTTNTRVQWQESREKTGSPLGPQAILTYNLHMFTLNFEISIICPIFTQNRVVWALCSTINTCNACFIHTESQKALMRRNSKSGKISVFKFRYKLLYISNKKVLNTCKFLHIVGDLISSENPFSHNASSRIFLFYSHSHIAK